MEFDKSKVYTALNAEELKVGSKCIFAHNLSCLRECVEDNEGEDAFLKEVRPENYCDRFCDGKTNWNLAYLVEAPAEKKLKWTDLKVGDIIKRPFEDGTRFAIVTMVDNCTETTKHIGLSTTWLDDTEIEDWEKVENDKD